MITLKSKLFLYGGILALLSLSSTMHCEHIIFDLGGVLFKGPFHPIKQGITLLQQCHQQRDNNGKRVHKFYILSNWSTRAFNRMSQRFPDIVALFDGVVLPGKVGYAKPKKEIYMHLIQSYNLNPQHCIFIDDSQANISAAQQLGITGILCKDFNVVADQLKKLNILK